MRETVTQRLLVRTTVWYAHLVVLLILSLESGEGRVAAKDEVKNTPPANQLGLPAKRTLWLSVRSYHRGAEPFPDDEDYF